MPAAILEQVRRLADEGIKQITLLGQTVNSYKYRNGDRTYCLADLLDLTARIPGIEWIRFVTSYPADEFYSEILHAMAASPKICRYLHIPAQSGSDRILEAMNRHYTAAHYLELLERGPRHRARHRGSGGLHRRFSGRDRRRLPGDGRSDVPGPL